MLERPKVRAQVLDWLINGKGPKEIAELVSTPARPVTQQAVCAFRKRHQAEIAPIVAEVERQIEDYAIARKVNRIADAQLRRDLLDQVRSARASGGTGMETGIVARQYKSIGEGGVVEEYKVDTAMLAEWRANDKQVAEELAQLPRPDTNIYTAPTYVLQIIGGNAEVPLG